jgi:hypothetical protein
MSIIVSPKIPLTNYTSHKSVRALSLYESTAFVDLGRFLSFLIYTQSVGLLGRGIRASQGRYLHAE